MICRSSLIDIEVSMKAETEKAIAVTEDGESVVWLPKSQIEIEEHADTITVTLPEWLAKDKGLI